MGVLFAGLSLSKRNGRKHEMPFSARAGLISGALVTGFWITAAGVEEDFSDSAHKYTSPEVMLEYYESVKQVSCPSRAWLANTFLNPEFHFECTR